MFSRRLAPEYRPWVAAQLLDPHFLRNRWRWVAVIQLLLVVIPQSLLAVFNRSWWNLVAVVIALLLVLGAVASRRRLTAAQLRTLLAHHGVTAAGEAVEPVALHDHNPFGVTGAVLLTAQVTLAAVGIGVVVDHYTAADRCRVPSPEAVAAVQALLGVPSVTGEPLSPLVLGGERLVGARAVGSGLRGTTYLAAKLKDPAGPRSVGPAVWRIVTPGGALQVPSLQVSAADLLAREVTPSSGYSIESRNEPLLEKARGCSRDAS
jgi:uncharacterized membrane protein